jgi:type I restriction enzyme S subunit
MRLPCYERYADTKLPWAPKLPAHWQILRNGRLFSQRVETGFPDLPILEVSLNTGVRVRDLASSKRKQVMSNKEKYKRALKGDIAYNMMRMWQGAVGIAPVDGLISPAYVVAKPYAGTNSSYYSYLFRTADYKEEVNKYSRGIVSDRNRLYWDEFKQMPSIVPPRDEQDKIVAYLRVQDAHIARFIKAKRELIGLLNEQKQTLIHQAVTKGIDPNVALKPSRIDWLGDIPAHWKTYKLKQIGKFRSGSGFPVHHQGNLSAELPFFKVSDMTIPGNEQVMRIYKHSVSSELAQSLSAKVFPANTIIFPKVGGALLTNKRRILVKKSCIDNNLMGFMLEKGCLDYIFWFFSLLDLGKLSNPGPVPSINDSSVKEIVIPFPDQNEQESIVEKTKISITHIDNTLDFEQKTVALMLDYREQLITEVITGQIDVRNWQPGLEDIFDDSDLSALSEGDEPADEEDTDESD